MSTNRIESLRAAHKAACETRDSAIKQVEKLPNNASDQDAIPVIQLFDTAQAEVERTKRNLDDAVALEGVRVPIVGATARGSLHSERTYRPDTIDERSFFVDLVARGQGDGQAAERLDRSNREHRDMTNASTTGGDFVPQLYLSDLWVGPGIAHRPFADALPKMPLPDTGTAISIPHLASGVSVAARSDGGTVSETDGVTAEITHTVNEISGQVDIGRIALMRSDPGLDKVIGETLKRRYDAYLDAQCLSGTGTDPQHMGIRAVSGVNSVTYTDASPTVAELWPKLYDAVQQIADARAGEAFASAIVMHPRRAAWMSAGLSSSFPLFQNGPLNQAGGTQNGGFIESFGGLQVILDNNIGTTYGAGTNEDEIYVVALEDLYLMEGPLYAKVFEDVLSGTGTIRIQVFAHSAFLSKRYPGSISVISSTGLATPSFA